MVHSTSLCNPYKIPNRHRLSSHRSSTMIRAGILIASVAFATSLPLRTDVEQPIEASAGVRIAAPVYSSDWIAGSLGSSPSTKIRVMIALHQQNMDSVARLVGQVSDPTSPSYGNFLSNDAIRKMTMPVRSLHCVPYRVHVLQCMP